MKLTQLLKNSLYQATSVSLAIAVTILSTPVSTPAQTTPETAQEATPETRPAPTRVLTVDERTFAMSEAYIKGVQGVCNSPARTPEDATECNEALKPLAAHLAVGQKLHSDLAFNGSDRKEWMAQHAKLYETMIGTLRTIVNRHSMEAAPKYDPSGLNDFAPRPRVQQVAELSCTDLLTVALGICSLYLVAPAYGDIMAAICAGATIYGWLTCQK